MRAITLSVPDELFTHLSQRAADAGRSLEAETSDLLLAAIADEASDLPTDLAADLATLADRDEATLWGIAERSRLLPAEHEERAELNYRQQATGLAPDEQARLAALVALSERLLLLRAEALLLLQQRGVDVTPLLVAR